MPSIQGIEISEDEQLMAENMGLENFIYDESEEE